MQITLEMINVFRKRENGNYPIGYLLLTLAFRILLWQFVELVQWGLWECYCRQLSIIICNQFIASKYFHPHLISFNFFPSHVYHALKLNSVLIDAIFWYLHQLNIPRVAISGPLHDKASLTLPLSKPNHNLTYSHCLNPPVCLKCSWQLAA